MTYRSVYTEQYQRADESGHAYDQATGNRFERAIYELEQQVLKETFARLFGPRGRTRYLDFACGTGRILSIFANLTEHRVGLDTSAGQLAVARQRDPGAELVCGNLVTDPALLGGRRFDLITCFRLLVNLEPEYRLPVLQRLREVLAPGGRLIVDNHMNRWSVLGVLALFAHKVLRVPQKPFVPPGRRGIISTLSEGEMRHLLETAGFEVEQVHRLFVLPGHGSFTVLPARSLTRVEARLARVPGIRRLSKNQIYVCRAAPEGASPPPPGSVV